MNRSTSAFDLATTFVHLDEDGSAAQLPVGPDFWTKMDARIDRGRLVSRFRNEEDWPNWEMHPEGDELIVLLSGRMKFIFERSDGTMAFVEAGAGEALVVPRGTWHTADVAEPAEALFITPGQGTEHRQREGK